VPGAATPARAQNNLGLGPLSVRNQFPVRHAFLDYTPEAPATLPEGAWQLRYQFTLSNSFINTQSPLAGNAPAITGAEVEAGLTEANFPASGYGLYIDAETHRHRLRLGYGLGEALEVGLELGWISFGGGFLDSRITTVERAFGGLNEDRPFSPEDRFDFYVIRDGRFLRATSRTASGLPQDPVLNLKWNPSQGGAVLPAFTLALAYKHPLERQPGPERQAVSSGGADWSYTLLFSKAVGDVVGHFQVGRVMLDVPANTFAERLRHQMFALEFRLDAESSFLLQSVTQSSIFLRSEDYTSPDFDISRPTDVFVLGYRHLSQTSLFELGLVEDYNQQRNEADITFFIEWGWRW
jgi:hypothetical protein